MDKLIGQGLFSRQGRIGKRTFLAISLSLLLLWLFLYLILDVLGIFGEGIINPVSFFVFYPYSILFAFISSLFLLFTNPLSLPAAYLKDPVFLPTTIGAFVFFVFVCAVFIPAVIKRNHDFDRSGALYLSLIIVSVTTLIAFGWIMGNHMIYHSTSLLADLDSQLRGLILYSCLIVCLGSTLALFFLTMRLLFSNGTSGLNHFGEDPLLNNKNKEAAK